MGMSIEELITFCEEEEGNHRVKAKRADDASGYTRSKDKNIRTSVAIREEVYGDFYKQIADTMRKYQKIQEIVFDFKEYQKGISYGFGGATYMQMVSEVVEDGTN